MPESGARRFRQRNRIRRRADISEVLRTGRRKVCREFLVVYKENDLGHDRFAVLVSRRLGNAVERNRVKRMFREIFRLRNNTSPPHIDILLQPREFRPSIRSANLKAHFDECLCRIKR